MKVSREERQKLLEAVQKARGSYEIDCVLKILQIELELAKDELVKAPVEGLVAAQAVARTYEGFYRLLTRDPPKIQRPLEVDGAAFLR